MEDSRIIALYNQRDERAITETSNKYEKYCYHISYGILYDDFEANECVNDTWLKTWNAIPPAQPNSLRLFLAKITRNLSLDRYKAKRRDKRGGNATELAYEELGEMLADTRDVESEVEQNELLCVIEDFLRSLPKRECGIFVRRYFYMASTAEIAKRYGVRESNVHKILSRTRAKLRKELEKRGYTV